MHFYLNTSVLSVSLYFFCTRCTLSFLSSLLTVQEMTCHSKATFYTASYMLLRTHVFLSFSSFSCLTCPQPSNIYEAWGLYKFTSHSKCCLCWFDNSKYSEKNILFIAAKLESKWKYRTMEILYQFIIMKTIQMIKVAKQI